MLFPIIDQKAYDEAKAIDFDNTDWVTASDYDFCYYASGMWAWSKDKTSSTLHGWYKPSLYHYTVSYREPLVGFSFQQACHNSPRNYLLDYDKTVLIPLRYFGLSKKGVGSTRQGTDFWKCIKDRSPKKVTDSYTFEDYVRFYNWYLSDSNPIYRLIQPMTSVFEVVRTPDGFPIGVNLEIKTTNRTPATRHIVGLFLCQSRFLSEAFANNTFLPRYTWYSKLKDALPDHLLYPVVAYVGSVSHSHDWFKPEYSSSLSKWLNADYAKNSLYWCTLFSGDDLDIRQATNIPKFLKEKGFL